MSYEKKNRKFIAKPVFVGGEKGLRTYISKQVKYPKEHVKEGIKGHVDIRIDINSKGKVIGGKVIQSLGKAFDKEALRVAKLLRWQIPGSGGRSGKVIFHRTVRIPFRAPTKKVVQQRVQYQMTATSNKTTANPAPEKIKKPSSGSYTYTITIS